MNASLLGLTTSGVLSVVVAPGTGTSYATTYFPGAVIAFDANNMAVKAGTQRRPVRAQCATSNWRRVVRQLPTDRGRMHRRTRSAARERC